MGKSIKSTIAESLKDCEGGTIAELASIVKAAGLPSDFTDGATDDALQSAIRRWIKTTHGPDGLADFESVECEKPDGTTEKKYMQLVLLDIPKQDALVNYYANRTTYFAKKTNTLIKRFNKQSGRRRQLAFPDFGCLDDDKEQAA